MDQTRDIFLFSCYTGLSYAEVYDLTSDHIVTGLDGKLWIQGQRRKSKEWFKVPLLPQAKAMVEKYRNYPLAQANGKVLPVYTNQRVRMMYGYLRRRLQVNVRRVRWLYQRMGLATAARIGAADAR